MRRNYTLACLVVLAAVQVGCGGGDAAIAPNPPAPPPVLPPPPPPPPPSPVEVVLEAPLGPGGGTLKVAKAGSPLSGLTITVPGGAYPGTSQWSVSEMKEVRPTLPPKTRQVGATIRIRNGLGFAATPFRVAIPVRIGRDSAVAAFFRDPGTGTLELIPAAARTDSALVVVTQHVSAAQMVVPEGIGAALRTAAAADEPPAGEVEIVLVGAALADLQVLIRTSFVPGVDDWDFVNRGSVLAPGGYCAGSTLSALHHHYTRKAAHGALNGRYDEVGTLDQDNPEGIRLASMVQVTGDWAGNAPRIRLQIIQEALAELRQSVGGPDWVVTQAATLALAMLTTGRAQALGIYDPNWENGHSIVAQAIEPNGTGGRIYVSDPNVPGEERVIEFSSDAVTPFLFAANAERSPEPYSHLVVMGVSALVDFSRFESFWAQLEAKTIGDDRFHPVTFEYRDPADTVWRPVAGPIKTGSGKVTFRTLCPGCVVGRGPASENIDRAFTGVYRIDGAYVGDDRDDTVPGTDVSLTLGAHRLGVSHRVSHDDPAIKEWLFSHFSMADVERVPFRIQRDRFQAIIGQEITFSALNEGLGGPDSKYRFVLDADTVETPFASPRAVHRFLTKGGHLAKLELLEPNGRRLAVDSLSLGISEGYHWRMECVDLDSDAPSGSFTGAQAGAYQRWVGNLERVAATPTDGFLSLLTPNTARQFGSFFVVTAAGQGATARALPLFPADSTHSPKLEARVYIGSAFETPGGRPGFSLTYGGAVRDNIYGAEMITRLEFAVSGQGWGRGTLRASVSGTSPEATIRFYARKIWEPNPAPAPPCTFGSDW
ncbi:MAG: hypothetical protein AB7L66_04455 [Gemmatimonadales bacterium]